jgi:hypothetical protein
MTVAMGKFSATGAENLSLNLDMSRPGRPLSISGRACSVFPGNDGSVVRALLRCPREVSYRVNCRCQLLA